MNINTTNVLAPFIKDIEINFDKNISKELAISMVVGFLRGKGFSWQQSIEIANKSIVKQEVFKKQFECITCSVGCADFLKIFLEKNKKHFDHIIVVTSPDDTDSIDVAKKYQASILSTDIFYRNGNKFDKGGAYNKALDLLLYKDWVCFIDVDIILEDNHKESLLKYELNRNIFYGIDRLNILTNIDKENFLNGLKFNSSLDSEHEWGFGYYQMFSMDHFIIKQKVENKETVYPSSPDTYFSDFLFRKEFGPGYTDHEGKWIWDEKFQQKLPWKCYHIGLNNSDRKSLTIKY